MRRRVYFVGLAALMAAACDNGPLAPSEVVNETWQLVSLERAGSPAVVVDDPSRYVMHLVDDRATVKSDCNSCSGSYSIADNMLQIGALACTRVACQDGSLDPIFPLTLSATHAVTVDDRGLLLQNNAATLRFQR